VREDAVLQERVFDNLPQARPGSCFNWGQDALDVLLDHLIPGDLFKAAAPSQRDPPLPILQPRSVGARQG
jgi:hypothetical protein